MVKKPANSERVEPVYIPGSAVSYSGGGYLVAQRMMEEVTQERFYHLAREIIFKPLEMKSSTYELIRPQHATGDFATGHDEMGEVVAGRWNLMPETTAAGLWTTPSELARFVIDIQSTFNGKSHKLISTNMSKQMLTRQPNSGFGLGVVVNPLKQDMIEYSHSGSNVGFIAYMVGFTNPQQGAVIMTNSRNSAVLFPEIIRGIADTYHWTDGYTFQYKIVAPIDIDPAIYQKYLGKFAIHTGPKETDPTVILTLFTQNNKLFISCPYPTPMSEIKVFALTPESETEFFNIEGDFEISFRAGNYDSLTISNMEAHRVI